MPTLRELSKKELESSVGNTFEAINCGSLQRIADATELMAQNYVRMETDLKYYKASYHQLLNKMEVMEKRIAAYKGVITKLKNKV